MENLNNPVEETKNETPVETVAAPVVEEVTPEPAKVEEAPAVEEQAVVGTNSFAPSTSEVQAVGAVAGGAIGVASTPRPAAKKAAPSKKKAAQDTVAIHSTKNVTWPGVGKVYTGYNIVEKDIADQWLTRSHVRLATPEEVAKEFGK